MLRLVLEAYEDIRCPIKNGSGILQRQFWERFVEKIRITRGHIVLVHFFNECELFGLKRCACQRIQFSEIVNFYHFFLPRDHDPLQHLLNCLVAMPRRKKKRPTVGMRTFQEPVGGVQIGRSVFQPYFSRRGHSVRVFPRSHGDKLPDETYALYNKPVQLTIFTNRVMVADDTTMMRGHDFSLFFSLSSYTNCVCGFGGKNKKAAAQRSAADYGTRLSRSFT